MKNGNFLTVNICGFMYLIRYILDYIDTQESMDKI